MYRLLVVDNEHIVVESVLFYFENQNALELETYGAYSASEALSLMERMKIDILITDINMPAMSGLELQKEVIDRWPRCKTIFLSGYVEFDYAQQAIRSGGCDYLLKSEGKQAIMHSVQKAAAQLDEEMEQEVLLHSAQAQLKEALPLIRQRLLKSILRSSRAVPEALDRALCEAELNLAAASPVYLLLGRLDVMGGEDLFESEASLFPVQRMVSDFLSHMVRVASVVYDPFTIAWLVQPREELPSRSAWERLRVYIAQVATELQQRCQKLINADMSFALAQNEVNWREAAVQRARLEYLFHVRTTSISAAILLEKKEQMEGQALYDGKAREQLDQARQLAVYLETGNRAVFFAIMAALIRAIDRCREPLRGDLRAELISHLTTVMISQMNRLQIKDELARVMDLRPLLESESRMPWDSALEYMEKLAASVFDLKAVRLHAEDDDMVARLNWAIAQNLGGDLSLPRLGEIAGMNPYYMARLYQKMTGERLMNTIANARMEYAKQLIEKGEMVNRDVAHAIGFGSEQAFHRFFKKMCNMTPQEYREMCKKDKP